jgi:hypothetical protein
MKWLRYQRVISLKLQVGNTNQRNKWANTDPRIYRKWDQVPRRSDDLLYYIYMRIFVSDVLTVRPQSLQNLGRQSNFC